MEPAKKKLKITKGPQTPWALNKCVACTKPLDCSSKILDCLHGMCKECFKSNSKVPGHFVCKCGKETGLSTGLINYSFIFEHFDKTILRNNYTYMGYHKKKYKTKAPCPNCVDKIIEVYCIPCGTFHCAVCHLMIHQTHKFKNINEVMEEIRSNLFKNKVDLCDKSKFVTLTKSNAETTKDKINTQKGEIIKKMCIQYEEIRNELSRSEQKMKKYVKLYHKRKLEEMTKTISKIDGLKEKYDFYLDFSECVLKGRNNADLDITHLVNKPLENVRKDFSDDIRKLHSTNPNIDLKVKFDGTLHQLIESVKRIITHDPHNYYEEEINEINKNVDITSCPEYLDATMRDKSTPLTIVDDSEIKKITMFNSARRETKRLQNIGTGDLKMTSPAVTITATTTPTTEAITTISTTTSSTWME
ncbi:uncharacterized protein LOC132946642 [Metopolophium dirhodum]|uniref:uncharacterized protein LOC132946642 n=1 Tax=Metopolophium dirhodum TaxID=44670 RepID=UPI00298FF7B4|nr:uncharacterized protein LOC132946642 [Metopolophium dirhodum]